jgi:hypothetical protein
LGRRSARNQHFIKIEATIVLVYVQKYADVLGQRARDLVDTYELANPIIKETFVSLRIQVTIQDTDPSLSCRCRVCEYFHPASTLACLKKSTVLLRFDPSHSLQRGKDKKRKPPFSLKMVAFREMQM